jgi:multidrug efflux pump subunit AcrB
MTSPNNGPHMGFIGVALVDPDQRKQTQREIADQMRKILNDSFPGVELLQSPGGLVASVFSNGYLAPLVVEVAADDLEELDTQSKAIAEVARTVPGIRDIYPSLQLDYPELRVETDRTRAALVDVSARGAAQTTLEATLGNINTPSVWVDGSNGQSYYVVTSYDGRVVDDPSALARIGKPKGAISAAPRASWKEAAHRSAHGDIPFSFVGQVDLMRTTFSGLGLAMGLAIMVVFMIMASQFKSLRLPFIMLFTIPVSLLGIVLALIAGDQGFSITALMGVLMVVGIAVSNGILLIDDANRRLNEGAEKVEAVVADARTRFVHCATIERNRSTGGTL